MLKNWKQAEDLERIMLAAYADAAAIGTPSVCPPVFRCLLAFELLDPDQVRVVILGQDPYHAPGKASGLAFGYHPDYQGTTDSSLLNILQELGFETSDIDMGRVDRTLEAWATAGVLLVNTCLSVQEGKPLSHTHLGWQSLIQEVLRDQANRSRPPVFLLWGAHAQAAFDKATAGMASPPPSVATSHPCKFSHKAGNTPFTGSRCFRQVNELLMGRPGGLPIYWYSLLTTEQTIPGTEGEVVIRQPGSGLQSPPAYQEKQEAIRAKRNAANAAIMSGYQLRKPKSGPRNRK